MTSTIGRHEASERTDVLPLLPRTATAPDGSRRPMPAPVSLPLRPAPLPPAGHGPVVPAYAAPDRPGMRWGWLVVGAGLAVLAVAALVSFAGAHRTMTVPGTVTIGGMNGLVYPGSGCSSTASRGTPVSIYDASGALVGTSSLSGEGIARDTWGTYSAGYADSCEYAFTADDVAGSSDYYRVVVGSAQSQGVSFTRAQLASGSAGITIP